MELDHQDFSIKYIEIVEDALNINQSSSLRPDPEARVNELTDRLETHFNIWQKGALKSIQRENQSIGFHFGNSNQLTKTLSYAPLYVDHVVLQDLILRQLQTHASPEIRLKRVQPLVQEVVNWKSLVEEGRVSIIPNPKFWDPVIEEHYSKLSADRRLFASPLYASILLDCSPLTDVPYLQRKLPNLARSTIGKGIAESGARQELLQGDHWLYDDPVYLENELSDLGYSDVFDLPPTLLGANDSRVDPEFWSLRDPDPDIVSELAEDVSGFREELHETVEEIQAVEEDEIGEIVSSGAEDLQREYEQLIRQREDYRNRLERKSIQTIFQSAPIIVGATHQDFLISMLSSGAGVGTVALEIKELYELWQDGPPGENNCVFRVFDYFEHHR